MSEPHLSNCAIAVKLDDDGFLSVYVESLNGERVESNGVLFEGFTIIQEKPEVLHLRITPSWNKTGRMVQAPAPEHPYELGFSAESRERTDDPDEFLRGLTGDDENPRKETE